MADHVLPSPPGNPFAAANLQELKTLVRESLTLP